VQRFGSFCQVEVAANGFLNKAELVQVHIKLQLKMEFIMPQRPFSEAFQCDIRNELNQPGIFSHRRL
jgi:hypothetical protein